MVKGGKLNAWIQTQRDGGSGEKWSTRLNAATFLMKENSRSSAGSENR